MNEPDVQEIIRHLVDESRLAGPPVYSGAIQISICQRGDVGSVQRGQRLQKCRVIYLAALAAQAARNRCDIGEFAGAFYQRMAGKDLLQQRRSRPRQSYDEDGINRI